jgi:cytochrome P450
MTGTVDLTDLDMWARGVPYAQFARLRRENPVAWQDEGPPNSGFWSLLRYHDILTASRDVATFSSARGISFEEPTDDDMAARRTIIDTDPPEHTKLRKIVSGSFSQRAVAVYQHFVEQLAEHVLDVGRSPNRHLSFGRGGPHLCLGAHLARPEVRVVLAALVQRVAGFELAGPPRRIRSNFTNGLRELPVRIRLA